MGHPCGTHASAERYNARYSDECWGGHGTSSAAWRSAYARCGASALLAGCARQMRLAMRMGAFSSDADLPACGRESAVQSAGRCGRLSHHLAQLCCQLREKPFILTFGRAALSWWWVPGQGATGCARCAHCCALSSLAVAPLCAVCVQQACGCQVLAPRPCQLISLASDLHV